MRRELFHCIRADIEVVEPYFQLKYDCTSRADFSSIQKITTALHILAYGNPIDREDEALSITEMTATETVCIFCQTIINMYSEQYLRSPNERDLIRLLDKNKSRGFPGMIRFIQCPTPNISYEVNGRMYHIPYYLTDCIYPHYAILVQTLKHPKNEMEKHFAKKQETTRKDVERAFGVL
ncbi:uncharacterized protein LOC119986873 [Tripterygium wilfordii]|uniref:uncharacterized protein LOC119986873 n=1 Tax=Tripterygium wilfordii TaxID=458696 RepID=UPI0018F85C72|nr:uncharacterized protein LOC119986873 [Tripterygium wilfordii]